MKKIVAREHNKTYYRILHVPIWVWVFFILPGHLTASLFQNGPDRRHALWLAVVVVVCAWRGLKGRLPGVELRPYVTHYGYDLPNLPYRVACYTAAWIDLLVPATLNLVGLVVASAGGEWVIRDLFVWLYYPLAAVIVLATALDLTPRARRSTVNEGSEKAWFYVAIWTVVPAQVVAWASWRLAGSLGVYGVDLARIRLAVFLTVTTAFLVLGVRERLPRTQRYRLEPALASARD